MEIDLVNDKGHENTTTNFENPKQKQWMPIIGNPPRSLNNNEILKAEGVVGNDKLDTTENAHNSHHPTDPLTKPVIGAGFPSISVNKDDILKAASDAKRYTSGGLQQITPWHLKRALFATSDDDCAIKASLLATRLGRGV